MQMKLGLYSMIAADKTPAEVIDLCREVGIQGIEWVQHQPGRGGHLDPNDRVGSAGRIGEMTRKAGLEVVDFTGAPEADDPASVKEHFEIAAAMGAPAIRMRSQSSWRQPDKTLEEQQAHVRRALKRMAPLCDEHHVSVQYETHWKAVTASASIARQLLDGLDPRRFGILMDPANMMVQGVEGWRVSCEVLGPYLHNVHCKNVWFEPAGIGDSGQLRWHHLWRAVRLGLVDWPEVIEALKQFGYDGYVCIEDCDRTRGAEERIRDAVSFLRPILS